MSSTVAEGGNGSGSRGGASGSGSGSRGGASGSGGGSRGGARTIIMGKAVAGEGASGTQHRVSSASRPSNCTLAPTRPRKRIYDPETNLEDEVGTRRGGQCVAAPYKKAERTMRYVRVIAPATVAGTSAPPDPLSDASQGAANEDINQVLADNFDDSLYGLGTDMSSSTYNMSEALHALPAVAVAASPRKSAIKQEGSAVMSGGMLFDDASQGDSFDTILRFLQPCSFDEPSPLFSAQPVVTFQDTVDQRPSPPPPHLYGIAPHQARLSSPELEGEVKGYADGEIGEVKGLAGIGESFDSILGLRREQESSLCGVAPPELRRFASEHQFPASDYDHNPGLYDTYEDKFQYILSVPTSTAVKSSEDTLSYLNQGQSYEIKIKKLGDITNILGRKYTSVVRICFHERRYQYVERQQLSCWLQGHPNERIVEVDVPLSVGISDVQQCRSRPSLVQFDWDPARDVAAFVKVNCISTEFTQRKHGGEKGVPFRIQIETYPSGPPSPPAPAQRLHVCGCQIKVGTAKSSPKCREHKAYTTRQTSARTQQFS